MPTEATLDLSTLHRELRALTDRADLVDLVFRLGRWLDGGASGDPSTLLTPDATATTPGGSATGRDAVVAQAHANHAVPTHHTISNVLPAITDDHAHITANVVGHFVRGDDTPPGPTALGGRYAFDAIRTSAGWRLCSVTVEPVWREQ
jgi:SnoaL-like domain